jgi:hypothetical protein
MRWVAPWPLSLLVTDMAGLRRASSSSASVLSSV